MEWTITQLADGFRGENKDIFPSYLLATELQLLIEAINQRDKDAKIVIRGKALGDGCKQLGERIITVTAREKPAEINWKQFFKSMDINPHAKKVPERCYLENDVFKLYDRVSKLEVREQELSKQVEDLRTPQGSLKPKFKSDPSAEKIELYSDLLRFAAYHNGDWKATWPGTGYGLLLQNSTFRIVTAATSESTFINRFVFGIVFKTREIAMLAVREFSERIKDYYNS